MILNTTSTENAPDTFVGRLFGKNGQFNQANKAKVSNGTINPLNVQNNSPNPISETREQFKKKASQVIMSQMKKEIDFSSKINEAYNRIDELNEDKKASRENIENLNKQKKDLLKSRGCLPENNEQTHLERLKDSHYKGEGLTVEEQEYLKNIDTSIGQFKAEQKEIVKEIVKTYEESIYGPIGEKLKTHPMEDAYMKADEIEKKGNQAVILEVALKAKSHIDDRLDDKRNKTDNEQTDQTDKEDTINQKDEKKETKLNDDKPQAENSPGVQAFLTMDTAVQVYKGSADIQKEIIILAQESNIDEESVKGIVIDETI